MKKVFVHRYKWSHSALRKRFRRYLKQEKVIKLETVKDGWLYGVKPEWADQLVYKK